MLGLQADTVLLAPYDYNWPLLASQQIKLLKNVFGNKALDIQHVGSTAVVGLSAKPIIDLMVALADLSQLSLFLKPLAGLGYHYKPDTIDQEEFLYLDDPDTGQRLFHLHIVVYGRQHWHTYVTFRDYLNTHIDAFMQYQNAKDQLAGQYPHDRPAYTAHKAPVIHDIMRLALPWYYWGQTIDVTIDRPVGYVHHTKNHILTYPVNYGFIPHVYGGDDEELDVYVLGYPDPQAVCQVTIIATVIRHNDVEDKLVGIKPGLTASKEEISSAIRFQEQYYQSEVITERK